MSRRDFLKGLAVGAAGLAMGGLGERNAEAFDSNRERLQRELKILRELEKVFSFDGSAISEEVERMLGENASRAHKAQAEKFKQAGARWAQKKGINPERKPIQKYWAPIFRDVGKIAQALKNLQKECPNVPPVALLGILITETGNSDKAVRKNLGTEFPAGPMQIARPAAEKWGLRVSSSATKDERGDLQKSMEAAGRGLQMMANNADGQYSLALIKYKIGGGAFAGVMARKGFSLRDLKKHKVNAVVLQHARPYIVEAAGQCAQFAILKHIRGKIAELVDSFTQK